MLEHEALPLGKQLATVVLPGRKIIGSWTSSQILVLHLVDAQLLPVLPLLGQQGKGSPYLLLVWSVAWRLGPELLQLRTSALRPWWGSGSGSRRTTGRTLRRTG